MNPNNNDNDPISNLVNLLLEIFTKPDATKDTTKDTTDDEAKDNTKISDNNTNTGTTDQLVNITVDVLNQAKSDENKDKTDTQGTETQVVNETNENGQTTETNAVTEVDNGIPKMDNRKTMLVLFTITPSTDSGSSDLKVKEFAYKVFKSAGKVAYVDAYLTTLKYNNKKAYAIPVVESSTAVQESNNEGSTIQNMFSKMVKTATSFMSVPPYYYYLAVFNQDDPKNSTGWVINTKSVMPILEKTYKELIEKGQMEYQQTVQTVSPVAVENKTDDQTGINTTGSDATKTDGETEKTENKVDDKVDDVRDAVTVETGGKKSTVHKITRKRNQNKKVFTRKNIKRTSSQK